MPTVPAELCGGPYDGRVGDVTFADAPPSALFYSLDDKDSALTLLAAYGSNHDSLLAVYRLVDEKPRKVQTFDDWGHAYSQRGVRYRYDPDSPCAGLIRRADEHALLTSSAREQVDATRRLLLKGKP